MRHLSIFIFMLLFAANPDLHAQDIERVTINYTDTLSMDIFVPKGGDKVKPLLVYVHGGGFSGGTRDSQRNLEFCQYFAERGWVTATISYHLTRKGKGFGCDIPIQEKIKTFDMSARNTHQAVKFLLDNQKKYQIDPDKIVLAGSSAGAEAVVQAAYWKETKARILPDAFKYAGVISMAGAILDIGWISTSSAIPTQLFHGTCDPLVPYDMASHHYCKPENEGFMMLYGAKAISDKLDRLNKSYYLVTDCNGGHEWAGKPMGKDYIHLVEDFLTTDVLNQTHRQTKIVLQEGKNTCDMNFGFCN
ncbi:MAG: alpha/beta hydrolase [Cyclobacteriaceae bacterium]